MSTKPQRGEFLRRVYTPEFKAEAIHLAETSEKSIYQLEEDLGISHGLLNKWKRKHKREGNEAFRGQGQRTAEAEELYRLRRENELLRQERDILKKALAIFTPRSR